LTLPQAVAVGKMGRMTFNWPPLPLPTQPADSHHHTPQLKPWRVSNITDSTT